MGVPQAPGVGAYLPCGNRPRPARGSACRRGAVPMAAIVAMLPDRCARAGPFRYPGAPKAWLTGRVASG